jgi:hypothetical protein
MIMASSQYFNTGLLTFPVHRSTRDRRRPVMARHVQKRFILKQAVGGLLVSFSAVLFIAALFAHLPSDFWSAAGILIWLGLAGVFALSILQLMRGERDSDPRA